MRKSAGKRFVILVGAGMLPALIGVTGCSNEGGTISDAPSKKEVTKRRDEMQKATQSGIPGKAGGGKGRRAR